MTNQRFRLAIGFSLCGDLRYLSHRDTMTLWQRALTRATIPVRFSQGFNPHMKMTLPLPRPVGVTSKEELLLIELDQHIPLDDIPKKITPQLPAQIKITKLDYVSNQLPTIPQYADYDFHLNQNLNRQTLQKNIDHFNHAPHCPINRQSHGRHPKRQFDLKKYLQPITIEKNVLKCTLRLCPKGTPRITEILDVLHINQPEYIDEICRTKTSFTAETSPKN